MPVIMIAIATMKILALWILAIPEQDVVIPLLIVQMIMTLVLVIPVIRFWVVIHL
jgi:hypothetical protein